MGSHELPRAPAAAAAPAAPAAPAALPVVSASRGSSTYLFPVPSGKTSDSADEPDERKRGRKKNNSRAQRRSLVLRGGTSPGYRKVLKEARTSPRGGGGRVEAEQGRKTGEKSPPGGGAGRCAVRVCRSCKLSQKIHFLPGAAAAAAPAAGRGLDGRSAPGTRGSPPSYLQARGAAPPPV